MFFTYQNGSNPYITLTNQKTFEVLRKYYYIQTSETGFYITGEKEWNGKPRYNRKNNQLLLRAIAQEWQADFNQFNYSWHDLAKWGDFFEEMGKKYGLLREFRKNGII